MKRSEFMRTLLQYRSLLLPSYIIFLMSYKSNYNRSKCEIINRNHEKYVAHVRFMKSYGRLNKSLLRKKKTLQTTYTWNQFFKISSFFILMHNFASLLGTIVIEIFSLSGCLQRSIKSFGHYNY